MRSLVGLAYASSIFAVLYVLFTDGPGGTYQVGGDSGLVFGGVQLLLLAMATIIVAQYLTKKILAADERRAIASAQQAHQRQTGGLAQKPQGFLRINDPAPAELHLQAALALGVCQWKMSHFDPDSPLLNLKVTESDLWTLNADDGTVWFRLPWTRVGRVEQHLERRSFYIYSDVGFDFGVQVLWLEAVPMDEYVQAFVDAAEARVPVTMSEAPPPVAP